MAFNISCCRSNVVSLQVKRKEYFLNINLEVQTRLFFSCCGTSNTYSEGQIIHLMMHVKLCKYFEQYRLKSGTQLTPSLSVIKVNTHKFKYTCKEQIL